MKYYYQAPTQWGIESDGGVTTYGRGISRPALSIPNIIY